MEKREREIIDPEDMVNRCSEKISFVREFFMRDGETPPSGVLEINNDAVDGLCWVLSDIEDDLNSAFDEPGVEENQEGRGQPRALEA